MVRKNEYINGELEVICDECSVEILGDNLGDEEKKNPIKMILLIALLIFIILCCITVIAWIIEFWWYRVLTCLIEWMGRKELVVHLMAYAVISPIAAVVVYNRIKKEKDTE